MPGYAHALRFWFALAAVVLPTLCLGPGALAQQSGVELKPLRTDAVGLGGYVRRGTWTPVRLDLFNESVEVRGVVCRWLLTDDDGDQVVAERQVDLTPQRDQQVWLYANPPLQAGFGFQWVFQVVDADSGELLAQLPYSPPADNYLEPSTGVVGVCGFQEMGLQHYRRWATTHERTLVIPGYNLETLPDRWYGLSVLSTLVWGPNDSGDPSAAAMSETTQQAVREWVYRGGHLVIVLPEVGQTWTDSGLTDLVEPLDASMIRQVQATPPLEVFGGLKRSDPVAMNVIDLPEGSGFTPVMTVEVSQGDGDEATTSTHPIAASRRYGFGQVTVVGLNLAARDIGDWVQPFYLHRVWTRLLGWRASKNGSLFSISELDGDKNRFREVQDQNGSNRFEMGNWVGTRVAKQATAGPAIGLAVVLFIIYWAVALTSFPTVLRSKGWDRFSWLIFLGVILVFSVVAWGGAAMLRPAKTSATHFTVLDIDGRSDVAHARAWVSLFVPRFETVQVASPSDRDGILPNDLINVVSSPGMGLSIEGAGYVDTQTYTFDATRPDRVGFPIRATTKPMVIDFLGYLSAKREGLDEPIEMPRANNLTIGSNGLPTGTVTHKFDEPLTDVLIIYCPGGSGRPSDDSWKPIVWRYTSPGGITEWAPGTPMPMPTSTASGIRLWTYPNQSQLKRSWAQEGFLGQQIASRRFNPGTGSDTNVVFDVSLLSFYDAMPTPLVERDGGNFGDFASLQRTVLRDLDMTALTTGHRLIIIGHLREGRCPVPLSVDGGSVPSDGWTVVRWIYDF